MSDSSVSRKKRRVEGANADYSARDESSNSESHWSESDATYADEEEEEENQQPALHLAAAEGSVADILQLLGGGADINTLDAYDDVPLAVAIRSKQQEAAITLIRRGANLSRWANEEQLPPLHQAAANGCVAVVVELIDNFFLDANMPMPDDGFTPIHLAAEQGHIRVMKALIYRGADVNVTADEGVTPLMTAAFCGNLSSMSFLARRGADIRAVDSLGRTALHYSSGGTRNRLEVTNYFLKNGIHVDARAHDGTTALHYAAAQYSTESVEALYTFGANIEATDHNGMTPFLYAARDK